MQCRVNLPLICRSKAAEGCGVEPLSFLTLSYRVAVSEAAGLGLVVLMSNRATDLREQLSAILNALPGVFSTPQWGGRAYKVPAKAGSRSKPKLLAFVSLPDSQDAVQVSFKLTPDRAGAMVQRHQWIAPHLFRTLAPAGWVTARVNTKRRLTTLAKLLKEAAMVPERMNAANNMTMLRIIDEGASSYAILSEVMKLAAEAGVKSISFGPKQAVD